MMEGRIGHVPMSPEESRRLQSFVCSAEYDQVFGAYLDKLTLVYCTQMAKKKVDSVEGSYELRGIQERAELVDWMRVGLRKMIDIQLNKAPVK